MCNLSAFSIKYDLSTNLYATNTFLSGCGTQSHLVPNLEPLRE